MKKNYIYYAIGAAILIYWYKNKDKNKTVIDTTTGAGIVKTDLSSAASGSDMIQNLPNSLDIVLNPESGAVQMVPSPATIMPYIKTMQTSSDINVSPCCNCVNAMSGIKTMPYTC